MKDEAISIISDNVEVLLDSVIENPLLKEIPILGTTVKMIQAVNSIRDNAYLTKVGRFLQNLDNITKSQRLKLIDESRLDEKRRVKFGEALFATIEQSDSIIKIDYLGCAFESFLNGEISVDDLRHIAHAIRTSFTDDLLQIVESKKAPPQILLKHNQASGLVVAVYIQTAWNKNDNEPQYQLSTIAEQLRAVWTKYRMS